MDKLVPEPNCNQKLCQKSFFQDLRLWDLLMGYGPKIASNGEGHFD